LDGGVDAGDRDQGQAQVANSLKQAVEGGLIRANEAEHRCAVTLVSELGRTEPIRPANIEMPQEANLVSRRFIGTWRSCG